MHVSLLGTSFQIMSRVQACVFIRNYSRTAISSSLLQ